MAASTRDRIGLSTGPLPDRDMFPTTSDLTTSTDPPPAKKRRLKLRPPRPISSPEDTIAVSRTKGLPASRIKRNSDLHSEQSEQAESSIIPRNAPFAASVAKSTKSGFIHHDSTDDEVPRAAAAPEDYGDFMSYYISTSDAPDQVSAGNKAKPNKAATKKRKTRSLPNEDASSRTKQQEVSRDVSTSVKPTLAPKQTDPSKSAPDAQSHYSRDLATSTDRFADTDLMPIPCERRGSSQVANHGPPVPHNNRRPVLQWIDIVPAPKPSQPDSISDMIKKVNKLSSSLAGIGGTVAQYPPPTLPVPNPTGSPRRSDHELSSHHQSYSLVTDVEITLPQAGSDDDPLVHGIYFIQNALRSWAQQRLASETFRQYQIQAQQHASTVGHSGCGLPATPHGSADDIVVTCDLAATPEGVTIQAFQEVLDSGCLRMNLMIPRELSLALCRLYVQIDHLINQDQRNGTQWQCMSYGAQLAAHYKRIGIWQDTQSLSQSELIKQQQMVDTQLINQLNSTGSPLTASVAAQEKPNSERDGAPDLRAKLPTLITRSSQDLSGSTKLRLKPDLKQSTQTPVAPGSQPFLPAAMTRSSKASSISLSTPSRSSKNSVIHDEQHTARGGFVAIPAQTRLSINTPGDTNETPFEILSSDAAAPQQSASTSAAALRQSGSDGRGRRLARSSSAAIIPAQSPNGTEAKDSAEKHFSGKLPRNSLKSPVSLKNTRVCSSPAAAHTKLPRSDELRTRELSRTNGTIDAATIVDRPPDTDLSQSITENHENPQPSMSPQLGRSRRIRRSSRKLEESKGIEV